MGLLKTFVLDTGASGSYTKFVEFISVPMHPAYRVVVAHLYESQEAEELGSEPVKRNIVYSFEITEQQALQNKEQLAYELLKTTEDYADAEEA